MGEWRERTLAELCESVVDCEHKTAPVDPAGEYFAVGTPAMQRNTIDYTLGRRISRETFEAWTRRLRPRFGDLLLAREAPVGPVVRIPLEENVAPGQRTVLLRPAAGTDSRFLHYLLTSPPAQSRMLSMAEGSTVSHLNVADVRALELVAPVEISEQRAIAEVLGALDDKIAANLALAALAEELAVTFAAAASPVLTLGELAPQARTTVSPDQIPDGEVDLFSLPGFDAGRHPERVSPATIKSAKLAIDRPSVLISKLNPRIPRIWDVPAVGPTRCLASTEFIVLQPETVPTAVLWALLMQPSVSESLQSQVAGTSGSHQRVKPADVLATSIGDPRDLGLNAAQEISAAVARAHSARVENTHLAAIRDALLPALMSGRLRVQGAEKLAENLT